jgi:uncharacterized protein (DUF1786 family)
MAFAGQVGERFDSLRQQVAGVDDKVEQIAALQRQILGAIEALRASSQTMGKKDWSSMAMSTMLGVVTSAAIPSEVARQVVLDFVAQLSHVKLLGP